MSSIDALQLRKRLGRREWSPPEPWGPEGWILERVDNDGSVVVTAFELDGVEWIHASMTRRGRTPSYEDLATLHRAVFDDGYAYQMFVPSERHVNIHEFALHLWGRADRKPAIPDFGAFLGSI